MELLNSIIAFVDVNLGSSIIFIGFISVIFSLTNMLRYLDKLSKEDVIRRVLKNITVVLLSVKLSERLLHDLASKQSSLNGKPVTENMLFISGLTLLTVIGSFMLIFLILPTGGFVWYVFVIYVMVVIAIIVIIYFVYSERLLSQILKELPYMYSNIIEELSATSHARTALMNVAKISPPGIAFDLFLIAEAFQKEKAFRNQELKKLTKKYVGNEQFLVLITVLEQAYDNGVTDDIIKTLDEQQEVMLNKQESKKDLDAASTMYMIALLVLPFSMIFLEKYMFSIIPATQAQEFFASLTAIAYRIAIVVLAIIGELLILYIKKSVD